MNSFDPALNLARALETIPVPKPKRVVLPSSLFAEANLLLKEGYGYEDVAFRLGIPNDVARRFVFGRDR